MNDMTKSEAVDDASKLYDMLLKLTDTVEALSDEMTVPMEITDLIEESRALLESL